MCVCVCVRVSGYVGGCVAVCVCVHVIHARAVQSDFSAGSQDNLGDIGRGPALALAGLEAYVCACAVRQTTWK